jgi:hypothetical protein
LTPCPGHYKWGRKADRPVRPDWPYPESCYGGIKKRPERLARDVAEFVGEVNAADPERRLGNRLFKVTLTAEFLNAIATKTMMEGTS